MTEELNPYWSRRLELSVYDGCLLWEARVIVPTPGQNQALCELHGGHPGCLKNSLTRCVLLVARIDAEIET